MRLSLGWSSPNGLGSNPSSGLLVSSKLLSLCGVYCTTVWEVMRRPHGSSTSRTKHPTREMSQASWFHYAWLCLNWDANFWWGMTILISEAAADVAASLFLPVLESSLFTQSFGVFSTSGVKTRCTIWHLCKLAQVLWLRSSWFRLTSLDSCLTSKRRRGKVMPISAKQKSLFWSPSSTSWPLLPRLDPSLALNSSG